MPSSGASQLTRSTRFQAIMMRPSACTRRCSAVPPKRRCCSRRYSIMTNLERTVQDFAGLSSMRDVADHAAGARARLLRIHARAGEAPHAGLEQAAVVIDQRNGLDRIGLIGLARHPVPGFRREQREPVVELAVVEQARLMQQELLAAMQVERLPCRQPRRPASRSDRPPRPRCWPCVRFGFLAIGRCYDAARISA